MTARRSRRAKAALNSPRPKARAVGISISQSQVWVRAPQSNWASVRQGLLSASTSFPLTRQTTKLLLILLVIGQKVSTSPGEASRSQANAFLGVQSERTDGEFELRTRFNLCQSPLFNLLRRQNNPLPTFPL